MRSATLVLLKESRQRFETTSPEPNTVTGGFVRRCDGRDSSGAWNEHPLILMVVPLVVAQRPSQLVPHRHPALSVLTMRQYFYGHQIHDDEKERNELCIGKMVVLLLGSSAYAPTLHTLRGL